MRTVEEENQRSTTIRIRGLDSLPNFANPSTVAYRQRFPQNLNQPLLLRRPQMANINIKDKDDAPENQHCLIISNPNLPADERPQKTKRLASNISQTKLKALERNGRFSPFMPYARGII